MAESSHSRFVDEIYAIPAPTKSKISVKIKEQLQDEIFPGKYFEDFRPALYAAEELNSRDLFDTYPPKFKNENKQYIYSLMNNEHSFRPLPDKSILITRWKPFVPFIDPEERFTEIKSDEKEFLYLMADDGRTIDWYLNFADSDLFAFYAGQLLAQDELQVLECVELASLREYLTQTINSIGTSTGGADARSGKRVPTPMLICNAERVLQLNTTEIYGNNFAKATHEQLRQAVRRIPKPQTVNLIAMEAPGHGQGLYTAEQIDLLLKTAYTSFKAAQILAARAYEMNNLRSHPNRRRDDIHHLRTVVHTGWWGCGAFGNNRRMSLITQMLAARWAQIDRIVFHKVEPSDQKLFEFAEHFTNAMRKETETGKVIEEILKLNIEWRKPDGT